MAEYDVTGQWVAHQSNGFDVTFTVAPTDGDFTKLDVEASYSGGFGQGKGLLTGDTFSATVYWEAGSVGVYTAAFDGEGRLNGHTYDEANPSSRATWFTDQSFSQLRDQPAGTQLLD